MTNKKYTFQQVKEFIDKEDELVSTEYINSQEKLKIKCRKCSEVFEKAFTVYKKGSRHKNCIKPIGNKGIHINRKKKLLPISCGICKKEFQPKSRNTKFCSVKCSQDYLRQPEYKTQAKINGSKGGRKSAESQQRRSKNETYFADLCIEHFGEDDVWTNQSIFVDSKGDKWDSDIFILSKKVAILWNGPFHYKQIFKKQSLEQVQNRDRIKMKVIENNGYINYVVKDLGKFKKKFVEEQFELFLKSL
jgi:hypothetical protein